MKDIDMEELQEIFAHFDEDGDGRIDRGEFARLVEALGADAPETELDMGFSSIDANNTGQIEFNEFSTWWLGR